MAYRQGQGTFPAASGLGDVFYRTWQPARTKPKAVVHLVHDIGEHGARYVDFAEMLCGRGYAVWAMDLIGHGRSADSEVPGYFGASGGARKLMADVRQFTRQIQGYSEVPVFLFGCGFGAELARACCERHSADYAGAVFCGAGGVSPSLPAAQLLAHLTRALRSEQYASEFLQRVAFGQYSRRCEGRTTMDWLNSDPEAVDRYLDDPLCGRPMTARGFLDFVALLRLVARRSWFTSLPYQFPVLFLSGAEDPVGEYGKGVEQIVRRLRSAGSNDTKLEVFSGMRHEVLFEPRRAEVYDVVLAWMYRILHPNP